MNSYFFRCFFRYFAGLTLALASLSASANSDEPLMLDSAFKAADQINTLFKSSGDADGLKGTKRVAITGFDVEFVTKGSASANSMKMSSGNRVSTNMSVTLVGVTEPDFQGIVDQLYSDFLRDVNAVGIEVVPTSTLMESENYKKMASSGSAAPLKKSGGGEMSTVFTSEKRAVIGDSLRGKGLLGAFAGMSTTSELITGGLALQKEFDATLVNVHIVVNFVNMSSSNSRFGSSLSGTATVAGKVNPAVVPGTTQLSLQGGGTNAQFVLQRALQIDAAAIPELKDVTSHATNIGLAVLSFALGSKSSGSISEKEAIADPVRYRELVGAGLGNVRELIVEQIKAVR